MKALVLDAPGTPDTMYVAELAEPTTLPGQVVISVEACGLNPVDVSTAASGHPNWTWPHVPGLDVAGRISALGAGVTGWELGDRVAAHHDLRVNGGFAEQVAVNDEVLAAIPDSVDSAQAAALPCAGMTAWQAIVSRLHTSAVDTVFITGGAGGVGGFAIQIAHSLGARVLTSCSPSAAERLHALGADETIDYNQGNIAEQVLALTNGRGVDGILDTRGSESATENLHLLAFAGGLVTIAGRPDISTIDPFTTAPSTHEVALGAAHSHGDTRARAQLAGDLSELMARVAAGKLDPMLTQKVPMDGVPAALTEIAGGHHHGKTVMVN
jgi:NADPH2:quinone reductase